MYWFHSEREWFSKLPISNQDLTTKFDLSMLKRNTDTLTVSVDCDCQILKLVLYLFRNWHTQKISGIECCHSTLHAWFVYLSQRRDYTWKDIIGIFMFCHAKHLIPNPFKLLCYFQWTTFNWVHLYQLGEATCQCSIPLKVLYRCQVRRSHC